MANDPRSQTSKVPLLIGAIILVLVLIFTFLVFGGSQPESKALPEVAHHEVVPAQTLPASPDTSSPSSPKAETNAQSTPEVVVPAPKPSAIVLSEPPLHLMDGYASPTSTPESDMAMVQDTLLHFLQAVPMSRRPPMGTNQEFTQALQGKNLIGVAFVPPDLPQVINGELTDRWGTPLFFHSVSDTSIEVRSAGPDKKMWTADDVVPAPANTSRYHLNNP